MNPIFISAWNDSGGTYLCRLLDGHPSLRVWPYEFLMGTTDRKDLFQSQNWFHDKYRWPFWGADLKSASSDRLFDATPQTELKSVLSNPSDSKHSGYTITASVTAWREAFKRSWEASAKSRADWVISHVESFFDIWDDGPKSGRFLAHCPCLALDVEEILEDFPKAQIIHVVRAPEACFADFRLRHPQVSAADYARKWTAVNAAAHTHAMRRPQSLRIVALQDLLTSGLTTVNAALDWANLPKLCTNPEPTWLRRAVSPQAMGPFGGLPQVLHDRDERLAATLDPDDREELRQRTFGVFELCLAARNGGVL